MLFNFRGFSSFSFFIFLLTARRLRVHVCLCMFLWWTEFMFHKSTPMVPCFFFPCFYRHFWRGGKQFFVVMFLIVRNSLGCQDLSFAAGSLARGMKSLSTKTSRKSNVSDASCGGDQLEQSCLSPRKSRLVMAVMRETHLIKHGSAVHSTIALSSGESEYCALFRSSVHALGIKAMQKDWHYGVKYEIHMRCASNAARGVCVRQ